MACLVQAAAQRCTQCGFPLRVAHGYYWCDSCRAYRGRPKLSVSLAQRLQEIERALRGKFSPPQAPSYYLRPQTQPRPTLLSCAYCGSAIDPGDRVCSRCGRTLPALSSFTYHEPPPQPPPPAGFQPSTDDHVFGYIVDNGGSISLSRAAEELGLTSDELAASIARLRASGKISEATS